MLFGDIYKGKRVLVTGHSGFKGSWLSLWLTQLGAEVIGFSLPPEEPSHRSLLSSDLPIKDVYGDIRNFDLINKTVKDCRPDIVFHLAAQPLVRESYITPRETIETNVMGTTNLYEACRGVSEIKAIVSITTDKVYANLEVDRGYCESDRLGGYDPYSSSKAAVEIITSSYRNSFFNLNEYKKSHNLLLAVVRAGNVIGGGDWGKDRLIPDLIRRVESGETTEIRNPQAVRPWEHVLEPLGAYLLVGKELLLENISAASEWNIGPDLDDQFSVGEIVTLAQEIWSRVKYQITPQKTLMKETNLLMLDCSKIKGQLGWQPVWNTKRAVELTIEWYRQLIEEREVISVKQIEQFIEQAKAQGNPWII